jgi:hypothetical protein
LHGRKSIVAFPKLEGLSMTVLPTLEEIQSIREYPGRRIKGIVSRMASSGIRLGSWDYLCWGHIEPILVDGNTVAAKILVYTGDNEKYLSFITPKAYFELNNWMEFRKDSVERIDKDIWVMRQLWAIKEGHYHHGTIKKSIRLKSSGIKRLIEDALWTQGLGKKSGLERNRYEFQTDLCKHNTELRTVVNRDGACLC